MKKEYKKPTVQTIRFEIEDGCMGAAPGFITGSAGIPSLPDPHPW